MAKLRFIGDQPRVVVCNGHPRGGNLGTVEPDEVLEVDDEVYLAHAWPETLWSEVEVPDRPSEDGPTEAPAEEPPAPAPLDIDEFNNDEER